MWASAFHAHAQDAPQYRFMGQTPGPAPEPTAAPQSIEAPSLEELGTAIQGVVTHYGSSYQGSPMNCGGVYSTSDPTIAAVGPARYATWECGQRIEITGPSGSIVVQRTDSCPGCSANMIDLSESGNEAVCGAPSHTCNATFRPVNER